MEKGKKIEELINQCRNGSIKEKCAAIADLQEIGTTAALDVLLELSTFYDAGVRANIADALGELGNETVGPVLETMLHDPESIVRIKAAESIGLLNYVQGIEQLAHTLQNDKDPLVRVHSAEALGRVNNKKSLGALIQALSDPDEIVRAYAADSIGKLGNTETLTLLIEKTRSEKSIFSKAFFLSASYKLGNKNALIELIQLCNSANDDLTVTILNLAAELANAENEESLKKMIERVTASRPALHIERDSLIKRISSLDRNSNTL